MHPEEYPLTKSCKQIIGHYTLLYYISQGWGCVRIAR